VASVEIHLPKEFENRLVSSHYPRSLLDAKFHKPNSAIRI